MFYTLISEKIERPVQVEMDISEEFKSDYDKPESAQYKQFVENFKSTVSN